MHATLKPVMIKTKKVMQENTVNILIVLVVRVMVVMVVERMVRGGRRLRQEAREGDAERVRLMQEQNDGLSRPRPSLCGFLGRELHTTHAHRHARTHSCKVTHQRRRPR